MLSKDTINRLHEAISQRLDPLRYRILLGHETPMTARTVSDADQQAARKALDRYGQTFVIRANDIIKKDLGMTEYQTHTAQAQSLEAEVTRLRAVNAELKGIIEAGIKPNNSLVQAARQALEALTGMLAIVDDSQAVAGYHLNGELETWEGFPEVEEARVAITTLREALEAAPQPAAVEQEPVLVVEREPSYMDRGHFYKGVKPHIDPTKVWKLPIGTKLYTAPQPARQPLPPASPCAMTEAEYRLFKLGWLEAEAAHGIGGEA